MKKVTVPIEIWVDSDTEYVAMDEDMKIFAYTEKPRLHLPSYLGDGYWYSRDDSHSEGRKCDNIDWENSLTFVGEIELQKHMLNLKQKIYRFISEIVK